MTNQVEMSGQDRIDMCLAAQHCHDGLLHDLTPSRLTASQIKAIANDAAAFVQQRIEEELRGG